MTLPLSWPGLSRLVPAIHVFDVERVSRRRCPGTRACPGPDPGQGMTAGDSDRRYKTGVANAVGGPGSRGEVHWIAFPDHGERLGQQFGAGAGLDRIFREMAAKAA